MKHLILPAAVILCGSRASLAQPLPERMPLRGHVSSPSGRPVAGVVIIARRSPDATNAAFWGSAARTDARGDFAFEDAEEGDYYLGGESLGLFAAPHPTLPYHLKPGSPLAQVKMGAPIQLGLQVLAPDGKPVRGQQLLLATRQKLADGVTHWRYDSLPLSGRALGLTVADGAALFVSCFALGWGVVDCSQVAEGSSIERAVTLQPGGTLRLEATEESSGKPLAGALVNLRAPTREQMRAAKIEWKDAQVAGAPVGEIAELFGWEARQRDLATGVDGSLTLTNLRPGYYMASLESPGFSESEPQLVRIEAGQQATCIVRLKPNIPSTAQTQ